jgi:TrmH family RNA methyltransferase
MITSRQHPEVKELLKLSQHKQRLRQGLFLAEGLRLVEDGLAASWTPVKLIVSPPLLSQRGKEAVSRWDYPRLELAPELMALAGDTETSQGIMALFNLPERSLASVRGDLALVLDGIRDPGNAGALLRSGSAAGVSGLIATAGTVDLSSPKVVRASMGGIFRVPWAMDAEPAEVVDWAKAGGWQLVTLDPRGGIPFHHFPYKGKLALVVGSEAEGVGKEIAAACSAAVTIPMPGGLESLNAAMAATLVLYQALIYRGL